MPPFLVIEILSAEDRMVRMQPENSGIPVDWSGVCLLVDPQERQALRYSQQTPAGCLKDTLKTEDPSLEITLESVLSA